MSRIRAAVEKIENADALHIVTFRAGEIRLKMLGLELGEKMEEGRGVTLVVKPTAVALCRENGNASSHDNRFTAAVIRIERGALLCSVTLDAGGFVLEAVVTLAACERLRLREGEEVSVLVNPADLAVERLEDD